MGNIFVAFGELTPFSWGIIGIGLSFTIQLVLCLKSRRRVIRCIPLYLTGCGFLFGGATSIGLFGSYSAGALSGNGIVGFLMIFIPAGNEPNGCVSIHLANAARVKYPAACCVARLIPRQLAAGYLIIAIASIGILFAWLVYWIVMFRKSKKAEA